MGSSNCHVVKYLKFFQASRLFFCIFSYITTELHLEISYISDIPIFPYFRKDLVHSNNPPPKKEHCHKWDHYYHKLTILPFISRCSGRCNGRFHPEVFRKNAFLKYFAKLIRKHLPLTLFVGVSF